MRAYTGIVCAVAVAGLCTVAELQAQSAPTTLVLPAKDSTLQAGLDRVLAEPPFRSLVRGTRLSVALVDLSDPGNLRFAAVDEDRMRYAASLPKIAIMLAVFDQIDKGTLTYTPELRRRMERMIRRSSNRDSSWLIRLVGFEAIASILRDPHYELYDRDRGGGLWVGKGFGSGLGVWRRDPMYQLSHAATARQVARFFVMLDQGTLISAWASAEMKSILGQPELQHKFVLGLRARPRSSIFRKSGTWREWHADAALVERDGKRYVAVALLRYANPQGVLSRLIVKLDDLIFAGANGQALAPTPPATVPEILPDIVRAR